MIDELTAELRGGGTQASDAALTLGLLIERATRGAENDDRDLVEALPPELSDRHLTPGEHRAAVDALIAYVVGTELPVPLAAWALSKTDDQRAVGALLELLARTIDRPEREHLAYQALVGLIPFGGPLVVNAVRDAAERGHGCVREAARQYLFVNPDQH